MGKMKELAIDIEEAKDVWTWEEVLYEDSNLLPAGRGLEKQINVGDGKVRKLKMRRRTSEQSHGWEGYFNGKQICLATDAESCAEFLVDWAILR